MPEWLERLLPIVLLLVAVGVVTRLMPKVEIGHSPEFKRRRLMNWVPLGLSYAFLYFGRYNLSAIVSTLAKQDILTKAQFGDIDGVGAAVYGIAFLLNGPLADRWGGRTTILLALGGSAVMNAGMAYAMRETLAGNWDNQKLRDALLVLNAANMYFQSFGAVSIVKVNAAWFHLRERGVLGGLFGILISLGLYFSYDWSRALAKNISFSAAFWVPAVVLATCFVVATALVRDSPAQAGHADFDTGDASSGQGEALSVWEVARRMLTNPIILTIIVIEFCSGFLRQGVMKWYLPFADAIEEKTSFVYENWGMVLCIAGILGGVFAGFISDHVFNSRRGPVAGVLYGGLLLGAVVAWFTIDLGAVLSEGELGGSLAGVGAPLGWAVVLMSLSVIGVHGMLSGTASADFGGRRNAGVVTGMIDGFVYFGAASQAFLFGRILPTGEEAKIAANWGSWPLAMIPVAALGLILCGTIWNAKPAKGGGGH